jgi:hypothetical protein
MSTEHDIPPKYNLAIVESVILEVAAELHPQHLTARDLSLKIVSDPKDSKEVEIAGQAIRNLREFGLFRDRHDDVVVPTHAALRAVLLLAG